MTDYLHDGRGNVVDFTRVRYIGTHLHRLDDVYVGELFRDMVVDRHFGNFGNIGNPGNPGNPGSPAIPGTAAPLTTATPTCSASC